MASCFELTLDVKGVEGTVSIVAKVPSGDPVSRATATAQHLYEREVDFYRHLARTVSIRTPACHHAAFDASTGGFLLLLENLAPAASADQLDDLSPSRAIVAVRELAGLHAPYWGDPPTGAPPSSTRWPTNSGRCIASRPRTVRRCSSTATTRSSIRRRDVVEWLATRLVPYLGAVGPDDGHPR